MGLPISHIVREEELVSCLHLICFMQQSCMKHIIRRFAIGKTMLTLEQPASIEAVIGLDACAFAGHTGTRDCFSCHTELLAARITHIEAAVEVCNFGT